MSRGCGWPSGGVLGTYDVQLNPTVSVGLTLTLAFQYVNSMPTGALQLKEFKSLLSPSLADHWGDLHMLLDAVPGFPSGIVNPLPLLHGQRELLKSFHWGWCLFLQKVLSSWPMKFTHASVTFHKTPLYCYTLCDADYVGLKVTMHKDHKANGSTTSCSFWAPGHLTRERVEICSQL